MKIFTRVKNVTFEKYFNLKLFFIAKQNQPKNMFGLDLNICKKKKYVWIKHNVFSAKHNLGKGHNFFVTNQ